MRKYQNNDYAVNKFSKGIVYRFVDRYLEATLADYLKENPDKSERDFQIIKAISDDIYYQQVLEDNRYEKRKYRHEKLEETGKFSTPSLCVSYIEAEERRQIVERVQVLMNEGNLTDNQKRRLVLYYIGGFSYREIAQLEQVHFTSIKESVETGTAKFIKLYKNFDLYPYKTLK